MRQRGKVTYEAGQKGSRDILYDHSTLARSTSRLRLLASWLCSCFCTSIATMANWGRALTTLDARTKPFLQMYNGDPAFVYQTTHRGFIIRRVTNATLDDLLRYCDYADPAITYYQPPTHAIYEDNRVHPYGKEQQDKQNQAIEDTRLSQMDERNARYGMPTMVRTSSMQAHLNGGAGRRLWEPAPPQQSSKSNKDQHVANAPAVPASTIVHKTSRQSMNSRRGSRSGSVTSNQSQKPKDPERRSSIAYSLTSVTSSSSSSAVKK